MVFIEMRIRRSSLRASLKERVPPDACSLRVVAPTHTAVKGGMDAHATRRLRTLGGWESHRGEGSSP